MTAAPDPPCFKFLDLAAIHAPLTEALMDAQQRVLDSGRFILGAEVQGFETEFADYCGTRFCIGVNSGLDALELALRAVGVRRDDEVIVPAMTFIASWLAVERIGARPVAIDVDPITALVRPDLVEAALTPRTRAIMPVHLYGRPCDMDELAAIASRHGLAIVEDAAQAHGADIEGRRCGALGHAAAFSFYPGKNLGALGDGGAVVTNDAAVAEKIGRLRNYGGASRYEHVEFGVNSRLDELQAAMLRVKLAHLDRWNAQRRILAQAMIGMLEASLPGMAPAPASPAANSCWHLFPVRVPNREAVQRRLRELGLETLIHYPRACHEQPIFQGVIAGPFPAAEALARTVLSLPFGPHLSSADAERIVELTVRAVRETR